MELVPIKNIIDWEDEIYEEIVDLCIRDIAER